MEDEKYSLTKQQITQMIENDLYRIVESCIEEEYSTDTFGNIIYKSGGKTRCINKIKDFIQEWEKKYSFSKDEIRHILKISYKNKASSEPQFNKEANELIDILEEIELEEKVRDDIEKGNIEHYERDI